MRSAVERLIERDRSSPRRIAVVGDPMVDMWQHGDVVPCQEGVSCLRVTRIVQTPGGAANAACQLSHWQSEAYLVAPWRRALVETETLGWSGVLHDCGITTGVLPIKARWVGPDGALVFRSDVDGRDYGADASLMRVWWRTALEYLRNRWFDAVLLSDYDKGWLGEAFVRSIIEYCRERCIPCVADCKRAPAFYAGAVLKGNATWQHQHNRALSRDVYESAGSLVVTCGPDIPAVWDSGKLQRGFPFLPSVQVANHVGAGDCFAAHLTLALAHGLSLKEAAEVAHSAGRVYVQREHGAPPRPEEIAADATGVG